MTHPERVEDYLEHIADAIERATRYVGNLKNLQALEQDQQAQDAIVRTIAVIGEAANRIQKVAPKFVAEHPALPWSQMRGIRNKVIHDYFDVAWDVVWETVKVDLPPLLQQGNEDRLFPTIMHPSHPKSIIPIQTNPPLQRRELPPGVPIASPKNTSPGSECNK
jgi:uncharacterized protein with HEPN domain